MDVKLSRAFRDFLNTLPSKERFKVQTDFAMSKNPTGFAVMVLTANRGKTNAV